MGSRLLRMALHVHRDPYPHLEFRHPLSGDQLRVVPERGGLVTSWCCGGREQLYFDAERFADPSKSVRGGIPVLFPVCGNLPGNQLSLPQGVFPMAQHGFGRDLPWQLDELDDGQGIRLQLSDSARSRASYPFGFQLSLELRLEPRALAIAACVEQRGGDGPMPYALGLHPYFQVSDLEQVRLEGFPAQCFNHLSGSEVPTADQLRRLPEGVDLRVDLPEPDPQALRLNQLELQLEPPFRHAVVWSDPPRSMVCLEPWSAVRGALSQQLLPGERQWLRCRYRVLD